MLRENTHSLVLRHKGSLLLCGGASIPRCGALVFQGPFSPLLLLNILLDDLFF